MNTLKVINKLHHEAMQGSLPKPLGFFVKAIKQSVKIVLYPVANLLPVRNFYNEEIMNLLEGKSIALVGNSPILDNSGYGADIANHDVVIRMNAGIIQSKMDAQHTGIKTDIWSTGAISCIGNKDIQKDLHNGYQGEIVLMGGKDKSGVRSAHPLRYFMNTRLLKGRKLYYCPGGFYEKLKLELFDHMFAKNNPSLGCILLHFLIQNIDYKELSLYGFSFSSDHRILEPVTSSTHNFIREEEYAKEQIGQHENVNLFQ